MNLTRVAVSKVQPGDLIRRDRGEAAYVVASPPVFDARMWSVTGTDDTARHYSAKATVLRDEDHCPGQRSIYEEIDR